MNIQKGKYQASFVFVMDAILTILSFWIAYRIRLFPSFSQFNTMAPFHIYSWVLWIAIPTWWVLFYYQGLYHNPSLMDIPGTWIRLMKSLIFGNILLGSYIFFFQAKIFSRALFALFAVINLLVLLFFRIIVIQWNRSFQHRRKDHRRILVAGEGSRARNLVAIVQSNPHWELLIVGFIRPDPIRPAPEISGELQCLGSFADLSDIVRSQVIDDVIFCPEREDLWKVDDALHSCEELGIQTHLVADFFNLFIAKIQIGYLGKYPILTFTTTPSRSFHLLIKRVLDFVIALITLVIFALPMLLIGVLIKIDSGNPVLFIQERIGLNGRKFRFLKFRSMVAGAEKMRSQISNLNEMKGPVFKSSKDPRITRVGRWLRKYSLDELPQLWNVLIGDMSLVGPRPAILEEVERYEPWQRRRLSMKPGMTCIWQVSGRNEIDFEEWMKMDLHYIDAWSLQLDFQILLKTIPAVLSAKGAR